MVHKRRHNRRANEERRRDAAFIQQPLPLIVQRERATANAEAKRLRYPEPPHYRMSYKQDPPIQPECYGV